MKIENDKINIKELKEYLTAEIDRINKIHPRDRLEQEYLSGYRRCLSFVIFEVSK